MLARLQLVSKCADGWEIEDAESDEMDTPEQKVNDHREVVWPVRGHIRIR